MEGSAKHIHSSFSLAIASEALAMMEAVKLVISIGVKIERQERNVRGKENVIRKQPTSFNC